MDDNEGMRITRGKGNRPKLAITPRTLVETPPGAVVLIAVRVAAHLAGVGRGEYTDVLCRAYDLDTREELYRCGDLYIPRAKLVATYQFEED